MNHKHEDYNNDYTSTAENTGTGLDATEKR
jgi:hypothetical protein